MTFKARGSGKHASPCTLRCNAFIALTGNCALGQVGQWTWEIYLTSMEYFRPLFVQNEFVGSLFIAIKLIGFVDQAFRRDICIKQASHWHGKRFTPWHATHAVWRASEGRTRDSMRADADSWNSACHILKCSNIHFQCVTTCDEIVESTCITMGVTHFANTS